MPPVTKIKIKYIFDKKATVFVEFKAIWSGMVYHPSTVNILKIE